MAERTAASTAKLLERFPALSRLGLRSARRRVPFIRALTPVECGPAALAMVLAYHGREVPLQELRRVLAAATHGVSAQALLDVAREHQLRARGVSVELEQLELVPPGSVLFWEFKHFVVLDRVGKDHLDVVDPAVGRRRFTLDQVRKAFTGVALLFEPTDAFVPGGVRGGHLRRFLRQVFEQRSLLGALLVTTVLLQLFVLALPLLMGMVVETVVPRGDRELLWMLGLGLASVVAMLSLSNGVRGHLLLQCRARFDARLTPTLVEHLLSLPFSFFQQRRPEELTYSLQSALVLRDLLTGSALAILIDAGFVLVGAALLALLSPGLFGVAALVVGLQLAAFLRSRDLQRVYAANQLETQTRAYTGAGELINGIESLKAMGMEARGAERWTHLYVEMANAELRRSGLSATLEAVIATLRVGGPLVLLWLGAFQVLSGTLTLGAMLAATSLAAAVLTPVSNLLSQATALETARSNAARLEDILSTAPEASGPARSRPAQPLAKGIRFENVAYRYGPLVPPAVQEASFEIRAGELVALVGRSGSGKSTVARLLAGLYLPTSGQIFFDGHPFSELELGWVRRQVGLVPQKPTFFSASIRANIAYFDDSLTLADIEQAARRAGIHDEIAALPMGYDTPLIGDGANLSGGQRQRIAIARALARQPRLLLLDEATSALDTLAERRLQTELQQLATTRVIVAHRLSTVVQADRILVLDGGKIVEEGTHASLWRQGGLYGELMAAQAVAEPGGPS